jgi:very-short-patch-repair endonuclease
MNDIIICKICKKEFVKQQYLTHHLKSTHKIDYNQYIKDNFDDFIQFGWKKCIECGSPFKERSEKCGKCYSKNHKIKEDQYIRCHYCNQLVHSKVISIHLKSHHNIEFLDYIKENLKDFERFGWCNCGICGSITKKQGDKHPSTCSKECRGKMISLQYTGRIGFKHTDETKRKISIKNTGKKGLGGDLNPAHREEVRKKISKTLIERGTFKGSNNPMFGKTHSPETIKKIFSHRPMNKLEKIVADELDKAGVSYYFQFFITENRVCKAYDFKIKGKPLIIEVDGDFWHGNPSQINHYEKVDDVKVNDLMKDLIAANQGYKVIRLWESDIKKDPSIILRSISSYIYS